LLADAVVDHLAVRLGLPSFSKEPSAAVSAGGILAERVEAFERNTILLELRSRNYRMTETARALGLERSHLYKKCQHLGIDLHSSRQPSDEPSN